MSMDLLNKNAHFFLLAIFLNLVIVFSLPINAHGALQQERIKNLKSAASFSGFEENTNVETKIIFPQSSISLNNTIDQSGEISAYSDQDLSNVMAYSFKIQNRPDSIIEIFLKRTADQKNLEFSVSGLPAFSKLVLDTPQGPYTFYSDWAGLIRQSQIKAPADHKSNTITLQIYSQTTKSSSLSHELPKVIEINHAPLGIKPPQKLLQQVSIPSDVISLIPPLQMYAEQISAVLMHYMFALGTFMDSKEQLETQRDMQKLRAIAHKDYHPSEQMCMIGGFSKSLASTEAVAFNNQQAINASLLSAYRNLRNASTMDDPDLDMKNRLQQFREVYCDPQDASSTLFKLCEHDQDDNPANSRVRTAPPRGIGAEKPVRINKDIDFARTIDHPLTMDIDFTVPAKTDEEEDVMALARNLYWPIPHKKVKDLSANQDENDYLKMRSIMAMSSIAHNSFAKIVAMKARAPEPTIDDPGWAYMKTMMRGFGMTDEQIVQMIGKNPSYFAQMDILTKKMYQNPDFYTHLYDKPANVNRIGASMEAIQLMQGRDHFDAALRREMLLSSLIEHQLMINANRITAKQLDKVETRQ